MISYRLDYTIEKLTKALPNAEQKLLKQLTGKALNKKEAQRVWSRVQDHKWYVSERLGRDVGFRVAAVDFIENIYEPTFASGKSNIHRTSQPRFIMA